ncbi:hypothetical protein C8R44DRAFT_992504 [Mycena epipterygia]|nr:hypothetical protein C8R44DRAFT_992504 [Mycena epipterygia]
MERVNAELLFDEAGLPRAVPAVDIFHQPMGEAVEWAGRRARECECADQPQNHEWRRRLGYKKAMTQRVAVKNTGKVTVDLYFYIDTASRGRARGRCRERGLNGNPKTKPLLALPLSAHSTPTPCCIAPLPAAYHPHTHVQIPDRDLPDHARTRACKGVQVGHFSVPAVSSAARGLPRGIRACTRRVDDSGGLIVLPVHGALGERVI